MTQSDTGGTFRYYDDYYLFCNSTATNFGGTSTSVCTHDEVSQEDQEDHVSDLEER